MTRLSIFGIRPGRKPEYDRVNVLSKLVKQEPVSEGECPAYPGHLVGIRIILIIIVFWLLGMSGGSICTRAGPQLEYWDDHYGGMFF